MDINVSMCKLPSGYFVERTQGKGPFGVLFTIPVFVPQYPPIVHQDDDIYFF